MPDFLARARKLDGNSLGRLPVSTRDRLHRAIDEWGTDLIRGWDAGPAALGFGALYTRFIDVYAGIARLRDVVAAGAHLAFPERHARVT